ncbi:MAG: hypothetical protein JXR40_04920 [Pontiellaceae bacterium]|nr:hypothetical protein [Pontiellaceae bacterium]
MKKNYLYSIIHGAFVFVIILSFSTTTFAVVRTGPIQKIKNLEHHEYLTILVSGFLETVPRELVTDEIIAVTPESKHKELAGLINRCMKKSIWAVDGAAPDTMQAMKQFVKEEVPCAELPQKGFEYDGMYYFSGGDYREELAFDFSYGFAMKKGESEVYRWHKEDLEPLLNATEGGTNLVAKTIEKLLSPTKMDVFVIGYAKQVMEEAQKINAPGPQTLNEARTFFMKHAKPAATPEYCCELDGYFWFSGGHEVPVFRCFTDGYAIKKGDSAISAWRITNINAKMKRELGMDETKSFVDPTNIPKNPEKEAAPKNDDNARAQEFSQIINGSNPDIERSIPDFFIIGDPSEKYKSILSMANRVVEGDSETTYIFWYRNKKPRIEGDATFSVTFDNESQTIKTVKAPLIKVLY